MPNRLVNFKFIRACFASLNPSQEIKMTSVSFSIFELNKRLSRRNLYLCFLYLVNFCITVSELVEICSD